MEACGGLRLRKEFEELDLDAINHIMDYHEATMYGYSVGYGEEYVDEPFYQLIFENKLKREVFMEWENRVLNFIKNQTDKEEKILGIITTDQIKRHIMAKKSKDYYKDMLALERAGKIGEKTIFNKEEAYIAAIIATRGIAEVYFLLEKSNAVICFWDLHGCIIFDSDKYIDDIVDCAQRYGINLEKTKKKYFETIEQVYQWLEDGGCVYFLYKNKHYSIYSFDNCIEFSEYYLRDEYIPCYEKRKIYINVYDVGNFIVDGERFEDMFDKIDILDVDKVE